MSSRCTACIGSCQVAEDCPERAHPRRAPVSKACQGRASREHVEDVAVPFVELVKQRCRMHELDLDIRRQVHLLDKRSVGGAGFSSGLDGLLDFLPCRSDARRGQGFSQKVFRLQLVQHFRQRRLRATWLTQFCE